VLFCRDNRIWAECSRVSPQWIRKAYCRRLQTTNTIAIVSELPTIQCFLRFIHTSRLPITNPANPGIRLLPVCRQTVSIWP
jgi:hypothetical protein